MAKHRFHPRNIQWFWRELSMLQQQGKSIQETLNALCFDPVTQQDDPVIRAVHDAYVQQHSLADALEQYKQYIDQGTLNFIRLAEQQHQLTQVTAYLSHRHDSFSLLSMLFKTMKYPLILGFFCTFMASILLIFVIPMFVEMFSFMGGSLPTLTLLLVTLSDFFATFWWLLLLGAFSFFWTLKKNMRFRFHVMLQLPMLKQSLHLMAIAELLGRLAIIQHDNKTTKETLMAISSTLANPVYRLTWPQHFKTHTNILDALRQLPSFPASFLRTFHVAQETEMFQEAYQAMATHATEAAQDSLEQFQTWTRTILLTLLGILVGTMVVAIYLPIFQMAGSI